MHGTIAHSHGLDWFGHASEQAGLFATADDILVDSPAGSQKQPEMGKNS